MKELRVGFEVHDRIWMGGLNYLSNLLAGMQLLPEGQFTPVLLAGTRPCSVLPRFSGMQVLHTPLLDRKSLPWVARKTASVLLGRDRHLQQFLEARGVSVLSHSGHLGRRSSMPSIGWVPDLQHVHLPKFFTPSQIRSRNKGFADICAHCTRIVVSSQCSLEDVQKFAPASAHKIDVLPFVALPPAADGHHTLAEMQATYHFDQPYFLLPNQFWAHKNHRVVIEALARLKATGRPVLVLATGQTRDVRNPTHFPDLMQFAEKNQVKDCFRVLGAVPPRHLAVLMHHSMAFINPSYFEGWSTSVEEAKTLGKQMLLSDIPVHREQAPARGIYFHPEDAERLAALLDHTRRHHDAGFESAQMEKAAAQTTARLIQFATQYSNIVRKALGPVSRKPRWAQTLAQASGR